MDHSYRRSGAPRIALVAVILGTLSSGCGTDQPATVYDCCVTGVYYVCGSRLAYGQCLGQPADTSGCTLQANPCPDTANR